MTTHRSTLAVIDEEMAFAYRGNEMCDIPFLSHMFGITEQAFRAASWETLCSHRDAAAARLQPQPDFDPFLRDPGARG